jgi:hypothetical protein
MKLTGTAAITFKFCCCDSPVIFHKNYFHSNFSQDDTIFVTFFNLCTLPPEIKSFPQAFPRPTIQFRRVFEKKRIIRHKISFKAEGENAKKEWITVFHITAFLSFFLSSSAE